MFCQKCGTQLADDARFCEKCGAPVEGVAPAAPAAAAPVAKPAQPYVPNPMVGNFVSTITNFFKNPIAAVGNAAKSTTHEWALFAALAIIVYALSAGVIATIGYGDFLKAFGYNLLTSAAGFFGMATAIWILMTQVFKKGVSFIRVFNMVGVAALPVVIVCIPNMLFALIDGGLVWVFETAAMAMTLLLLYEGIQKFETLEKPVFLGFCIAIAAVVLVVWLVELLGNEIFYSYSYTDTPDMYESLDDLADMFGGF